ncbi:MAG: hypothetical protein QOI95_2498 [Acidimicrobiaceae bacterium]
MNGAAWVFLIAAAVVAAGDWVAVVRGKKTLEYVCKPLTIILLMGLAATLDVGDGGVRGWFLAALALSMLGDVWLMLPRDLFVAGLLSFLLAHVAYIVGMWVDGVSFLGLAIGLAVAALAAVVVGSRVLRGVRAGDDPAMVVPVSVYMAVISLMVASAVGTEEPVAIGGAALFFCSDALIAWERFVHPRSWHRLAIIVTYHLAQAGLTLSLIT